jgi:hypothetical protein
MTHKNDPDPFREVFFSKNDDVGKSHASTDSSIVFHITKERSSDGCDLIVLYLVHSIKPQKVSKHC